VLRRAFKHAQSFEKGKWQNMKRVMEHPLVIRDLSPYASPSEDRIALIDSGGNIVGSNDIWMAFEEQFGRVQRTRPGTNYLDVCQCASASSQEAQEAVGGIRAVLNGKLRSFTMDYSDNSRSGARYYRMDVLPIHYKRARLVIAHADITESRLSKEKSLRRVQDFARRLINAQEEERERIAREIHDDLCNRVALLSLLVRQIANRRSSDSGTSLNGLSQVIDNIADLSNAMRNLAHCLHPPVLGHAGICAALEALCKQFEKAQGVEMDVVVPAELPPLPDEVALCIFRVSQECLNNIAKHADAKNVSVVLERTQRDLRLKVADTGSGFVPWKNSTNRGLGLVSMKERVRCVKGQLKIQSAPGRGTEICVTIPLSQRTQVIKT